MKKRFPRASDDTLLREWPCDKPMPNFAAIDAAARQIAADLDALLTTQPRRSRRST